MYSFPLSIMSMIRFVLYVVGLSIYILSGLRKIFIHQLFKWKYLLLVSHLWTTIPKQCQVNGGGCPYILFYQLASSEEHDYHWQKRHRLRCYMIKTRLHRFYDYDLHDVSWHCATHKAFRLSQDSLFNWQTEDNCQRSHSKCSLFLSHKYETNT